VPVQLNADEFIPTQRDEVKKAINEILDDFMEALVNATIIFEIKSIAAAANIPQGFSDGVKFRKTGKNIGQVINTWGTEEKPLAIWFNYGTRDHGSKGPWPLHWKNKTGGKDIYAKWVRGVPRTMAMELGFNIGKKRLAEEASKIVLKELHFVK